MEIVDQLGEGSHLGLQRRNRLGGKAPDPVLNRLQLAAQHRQRGTQLMGDIGHQIATHLLVALQGAGELVKILRQAAELIAAGHRHAGGKVACRQLMGAFHQPLHRRQQTAGQRESGQRGKQGGKGDNQPAGALLLPVEVNVGIARQPLYRRGDHFAHLRAVDHDAALGAVLRDALTRPHQHAPRLIHHPEHGAPAVGRHFRPRARAVRGAIRRRPVRGGVRLHGVPRRRAVVIIPFEGAQQLEDKAVIIAQKRPAAMLGILLAQRVAEHG